jgi:tetratricopeptide (TPR) repeat protein
MTLAVITSLLFTALNPRLIIIQPISVPKELEDRGYAPGIVAIRLRDEIKKSIDYAFDGVYLPVTSLGYERYVSSEYEFNSAPEVATNSALPTFSIPELGLPFDVVVAFLRNLSPINRTISGEIIKDDRLFSLKIRFNTNVVHISESVELNRIDELFEKATRDILKFVEPFYLLGNDYKENAQEAIDHAKTIIAEWPLDKKRVALSHNFIGAILLSKSRLSGPDGAIAELNTALMLDDSLASAHINLGLAYREQGEIDKAISEFKKAIKIDSNSARAHSYLGDIFKDTGRLEEAACEFQHEIIDLQRAVKNQPSSAAAHNELAASSARGIKETYDNGCDSFAALLERFV